LSIETHGDGDPTSASFFFERLQKPGQAPEFFCRIQPGWGYTQVSGDTMEENHLPSGKRLQNYGKSQFLVGKSIIFMAMFNSYVKLPERINGDFMVIHILVLKHAFLIVR